MKYSLLLVFLINLSAVTASDYLVVENTEVKQADSNASKAKQKAMSLALRNAFNKVLPSEISAISERQIQDCIYDYSIDREKFSDSVYIGRFSYKFKKKKVAALLKSYGIKMDFEETLSNNVRLAVYLKDYIENIQKLESFGIKVEKFSNEKIVFSMDKKFLADFQELHIKWALL
ncbi:MAG: hypothetical protein LBF57_00300 [Holosporaceae bacterium]|jgi:hypothetical protein|nr:hypothetical protein [Holosporaceae bacterium]